jgi:hypothetical protein
VCFACVRFDTKIINHSTYICREKGVGEKKVLVLLDLTFVVLFLKAAMKDRRWEGQMPFELDSRRRWRRQVVGLFDQIGSLDGFTRNPRD